jgi:signal transduction histidine kinase
MWRLRDLSFQRKLTVVSFVASASTLLLVGVVFTSYAVYNYRSGLGRQLAIQADILGSTVTPALIFQDEKAAREALEALRAEPRTLIASIYLPDGKEFATYRQAGTAARRASHPPPAGMERMDYGGGYLEVARQIGTLEHPLGTVYLRADLAELKRRIRRYVSITLAVMSISLLVSMGLASFLHKEISGPVLNLVNIARTVAFEKTYGVRAVARGRDELGTLVAAFNEMLDDLQKRDEQLRTINRDLRQRTDELARKNEEVEAFVYIVSHDLRGPLVNLQGFGRELQMSCDALAGHLAGAPLPAAIAAEIRLLLEDEIPTSLRFISASTTKFERLINALLELSRTGRREVRPELLDMSALVASTLDSLQRSIEESGAEVVVEALPPARGDATAVGQVLSNLIMNALRYLQPGRPGRIELGGESSDGVSTYFIKDNGVGLAETAQRKLFQVFQRFRPDLAQGDGIGLAMVKRVVERHGGRVWAESIEGAGTTFLFTLPSADAAAGGAP